MAPLLFLCGMLYVNFLEWAAHKYLLHGLGKKKGSLFSFHWFHHRLCRTNHYYDLEYKDPWWSRWSRSKEVMGLFFLFLIHSPILLISIPFYAGASFQGFLYYFLHSKSHMNPEWTKKWMPWHYDHHMGKNQNFNWCVTYPFWDYVFRTRKKY